MKKTLFIMLSVLLFFACAMPETKIYSIQPSTLHPLSKEGSTDKVQRTTESKKSMGILMESPRHLSQPYIVYRSSPYQLEISKYSKWISAPSEMVRGALKEYLSSTGLFQEVRGSSIVREEWYSLEINLKKFEQSEEGKDSFGDILFDMKLISPQSGELYHGTVSKHVRLDDRTFLSLAKGLSIALSDSIKEVTDGIVPYLKQ